MKLKFTALLMALAILGAFAIAPLTASAAPRSSGTLTATGAGTTADNAPTTVPGTVTNLVFSVVDGVLTASGTFTPTTGAPVDFVAALVDAGNATCTILNLTLGPLDLDLLGLGIHLDTVHLVVDATPGPGNLLGNLLCSVAHLLDQGNINNGLANLLNRIFGLLG